VAKTKERIKEREGRKETKREEAEEKKKKKKPKKKNTMEIKKMAKKWEIWDKEKVTKSEEEAKKLVLEKFHM